MKYLLALITMLLTLSAQAGEIINLGATLCTTYSSGTICNNIPNDSNDTIVFTLDRLGNVTLVDTSIDINMVATTTTYLGIIVYSAPTVNTNYNKVYPFTVPLTTSSGATATLTGTYSLSRSGSGRGGWSWHYFWSFSQLVIN